MIWLVLQILNDGWPIALDLDSPPLQRGNCQVLVIVVLLVEVNGRRGIDTVTQSAVDVSVRELSDPVCHRDVGERETCTIIG